MNEYLNDAKFIAISPDDYDLLQKYKADELKSNPAHLGDKDAPLNVEPFFHGLPDVIANYRRQLLVAHGGKLHNKKWRLHYNVKTAKSIIHNWIDFTENELKTVSDNAFFEKIAGFLGVDVW